MGLLDKANDFLGSEQGEAITDQAIQAGADAADKVTGGKFTEQIEHGRTLADDRLGAPAGQPADAGFPNEHPAEAPAPLDEQQQ